MEPTKIKLAGGPEVQSVLALPDDVEFFGKRPLAIFIPSSAMKDLDGNSPAYPVKNTMKDLAAALGHKGIATYRFENPEGVTIAALKEIYQAAIEHPRISQGDVTFIGFGDGANLLAKNYYDLFNVHPFRAAVLVSSSVQPIHLNNFTCPYFLVHGMNDPLFTTLPYSKLQEAVHHHQARYGDPTTQVALPETGREVAEKDHFHSDAIEQIVDWVSGISGYRGQFREVA